MINKDNLKPFHIDTGKQNSPVLSVTESSMTFGRGCIQILGKKPYAKIYFDDYECALVLEAKDNQDNDTFEFVGKSKSSQRYIRLKSMELKKKICRLAGKSIPFRVRGVYDEKEDWIVFDLKKAYPLSHKESQEV